ncbi:MAG: hypothetical protein ACTHQM_23365 [Thermoanaerobaculia bacterium]
MNRWIFLCVVILAACRPDTPESLRIDAARQFVRECKRNGSPRWSFRAHAMGDTCDVLVVESLVPLDQRMVDRVHYAAPGRSGVQTFLDDHRFRAAAYTDPKNGLWTFGAITREEARSLKPCD